MNVRSLNGGTTRLQLAGHKRRTNPDESKSRLQFDIGVWLSRQYPYDQIFEEVYVLGENLYLDFFIPSLKLVVEVNGRQHETFVPHFHGTKRDFVLQQQRDRRKAEWCLKNGFELRMYTAKDVPSGNP
jgi:hypothetical protein